MERPDRAVRTTGVVDLPPPPAHRSRRPRRGPECMAAPGRAPGDNTRAGGAGGVVGNDNPAGVPADATGQTRARAHGGRGTTGDDTQPERHVSRGVAVDRRTERGAACRVRATAKPLPAVAVAAPA